MIIKKEGYSPVECDEPLPCPFCGGVPELCSWLIQRGMKPQGAAEQDNAKLLKFAFFRLIKNLRAILFGLSVLIANAQQETTKIPHKRRLRHGTQEQVYNLPLSSNTLLLS